MALNALLPSVREKKRYICFTIDKIVSAEEAKTKILSRIKKWIGEKDYALGRVHFMEKYYSKNKGIISCNHKQCADVKAGMLLLNELEIVYVSGILNKAKQKLKEL